MARRDPLRGTPGQRLERRANDAAGDEGVERIKQLTNGVGADSVLECVGTQESMMQAIKSTRPGGSLGYVGVPHGVTLDGADLFFGTSVCSAVRRPFVDICHN